MADSDMLDKVATGSGFIAALDQSGGSTPKALEQYGVPPTAYSGEVEMFDRVHEMRTRIMTSPSFTGERVLGAILFEGTMERAVRGLPTATYLWKERGIVPFLKVDKGLAELSDGVQVMKDMPDLDASLACAVAAGVFETKMRSVITTDDPDGAIPSGNLQVVRPSLGSHIVLRTTDPGNPACRQPPSVPSYAAL